MYSSASSVVKAPLSRNRSTKQTAIQPSTFKMSCTHCGKNESLRENQSPYRVFLRGRHLFNGEGIVQQAVAGEVLANILLDELDTEIWVVDALDLVPNTADCRKMR